MILNAERVVLRSWSAQDREPLAAMLADPEVMHDYPLPLTRSESDAKLDRYQGALEQLGYGRMAVVGRESGEFLGYVGIMPVPPQHSAVGNGVEIGWRLVRRAWGQGIATEAAAAALKDGFERHRFPEVLSYTSPTNLRSQAVMKRLGLERRPERDFSYTLGGVHYSHIVYVALPPAISSL